MTDFAEYLAGSIATAMTDALNADREGITAIIENRRPTTSELLTLSWPFVVGGTALRPTIGALGLINGILLSLGANRIAAQYDGEGQLIRFCPCDDRGRPVLETSTKGQT
jgi:hypothetical protein